jgi:hypothetical protein
VALRPAQVHPQEHLGPVGGLGAARPGADRQEGGPLVVLAREEERRTFAPEVGLEACGVAVELGLELRVGCLVEQLDRGQEVVGATEQALPQRELVTERIRFAEDFLGAPLVVPEPGLLGERVELADALGLCG